MLTWEQAGYLSETYISECTKNILNLNRNSLPSEINEIYVNFLENELNNPPYVLNGDGQYVYTRDNTLNNDIPNVLSEEEAKLYNTHFGYIVNREMDFTPYYYSLGKWHKWDSINASPMEPFSNPYAPFTPIRPVILEDFGDGNNSPEQSNDSDFGGNNSPEQSDDANLNAAENNRQGQLNFAALNEEVRENNQFERPNEVNANLVAGENDTSRESVSYEYSRKSISYVFFDKEANRSQVKPQINKKKEPKEKHRRQNKQEIAILAI